MTDTSRADEIRREMIATGQPWADAKDEAAAGRQLMSTDEMLAAYDVVGFAAPFVVVTRKSDGKRGTLEFTGRPRTYFGWQEDV